MDRKGCRNIYERLQKEKKITIKTQSKWNEILQTQTQINWENVYIHLNKITKDTKLKWFQYRILHIIMASNSFLNKIGIKTTNYVPFARNIVKHLHNYFGTAGVQQYSGVFLES